MDTSTLHTATEELAALLSEVTQGDLEHRTPWASRDVGDLYLHLIDQNLRVAAAIASETVSPSHRTDPKDRKALGASLDFYGGGLDVGYRQTAQLTENAFASVTVSNRLCRMDGFDEEVEVAALYEMQICNAVIHTWDIAQAMGFSYQPASDVAWRVLKKMLSQPADPRGSSAASLDDPDVFGCVLKLSGRA
jgi:uncharacterized protein (TIGR03083 family)